mmetsp:Transcript_3468/g.3925  ORF Transcript_3468/g.3925 Transcript_3468/m.3925 type:complete len:89 (-) Transcript_3468:15-281(-)
MVHSWSRNVTEGIGHGLIDTTDVISLALPTRNQLLEWIQDTEQSRTNTERTHPRHNQSHNIEGRMNRRPHDTKKKGTNKYNKNNENKK